MTGPLPVKGLAIGPLLAAARKGGAGGLPNSFC